MYYAQAVYKKAYLIKVKQKNSYYLIVKFQQLIQLTYLTTRQFS